MSTLISEERKLQIIGYLVLIVFLAPIVLYFWAFHGSLSSDRNDWSTFGSYFGGIYSVLVSSFTAAILYRQFRMQIEFQKHQYDRGYIDKVESRAERILQRMLIITRENEVMGGGRRNDANFTAAVKLISPAKGDSTHPAQQTINIDFFFEKYHDLLDLWLAFYRLLSGLESVDEEAYRQAKIGLLDQAHSFLGFQTCRALDIVVKNRRGGEKPDGKFYFLTEAW